MTLLNVTEPAGRLWELLGSVPAFLIGVGAVVLVVVIFFYILRKFLLSGRRRQSSGDVTSIDTSKLFGMGPLAEDGPVLEFYNVPVRLAAIVLAPAGRVHQLPPVDRIGEICDAVLPGLSAVFWAHQSPAYFWPPQVSARGFANRFLLECRLPDDGGKDTPWCAVAGPFRLNGRRFLAGLVMRTSDATSHGSEVLEDPGDWLARFRIKASSCSLLKN